MMAKGDIGIRVEPNEGQTILQASTRMAWRYVGKLDAKTRKEGMVRYLKAI
jgi:hypothetical protein